MNAPKPRRESPNLALDIDRLNGLLGNNPIAKSVLEFTARAQPVHLEELSTVDRLHKSLRDGNGNSWSRRPLIRALRELALTGCGQLRVGRHGAPSRFQWKVAPAELCSQTQPGLVTPPAPSRPETSRLLEHVFHLRRDHPVTLRLPKDMTEKEAERLAKFISALPFA